MGLPPVTIYFTIEFSMKINHPASLGYPMTMETLQALSSPALPGRLCTAPEGGKFLSQAPPESAEGL